MSPCELDQTLHLTLGTANLCGGNDQTIAPGLPNRAVLGSWRTLPTQNIVKVLRDGIQRSSKAQLVDYDGLGFARWPGLTSETMDETRRHDLRPGTSWTFTLDTSQCDAPIDDTKGLPVGVQPGLGLYESCNSRSRIRRHG